MSEHAKDKMAKRGFDREDVDQIIREDPHGIVEKNKEGHLRRYHSDKNGNLVVTDPNTGRVISVVGSGKSGEIVR